MVFDTEVCSLSLSLLPPSLSLLVSTSGQTESQGRILSGHISTITHATFHPHHSHTLITTSQDRTFKVVLSLSHTHTLPLSLPPSL